MHAARINNDESILCGNEYRKHVRQGGKEMRQTKFKSGGKCGAS